MAQRAIIGINGDLLPFDDTLDKIQTQGIGGGSVTWVPEAATRCETLRVTANGSYSAATAGVYGWDNVLVSVPGSSVTGKDPDTGEEVEVHPDPETGEIVKTVIPEEIRVTTLPTKTTYANGETIDYTGIVVHSYSSTGRDLGAIPFSELVFPVTTAQAGDDWTDGHGLNAMMIYYTSHWSMADRREFQVFVDGSVLGRTRVGRDATIGGNPPGFGINGPATILVTKYNGGIYAARITGENDGCTYYQWYPWEPVPPQYGYQGWANPAGTTYKTKLNEFTRCSVLDDVITEIPDSSVDPTTIDPSTLHAVQSLPVQWNRTGGGAILETSFDISVTGGNT